MEQQTFQTVEIESKYHDNASNKKGMKKVQKRIKQERPDQISNLPDTMLIHILSSLPVRQAATTSILSKRWRFLWKSIPHLELDFEQVLGIRGKDIKADGDFDLWLSDIKRWLLAVYYIIFLRQAPLVSCSITVSFFEEFRGVFDEIFLFLRRKGIKELFLNNTGDNVYLVSDHIFFCQSLEKMELMDCEVRLPHSFKEFGCLKSLVLDRVNVTDNEFEHLVSCCPVLESMQLYGCLELGDFRISARRLLSLVVLACEPVHISLKDAPSLKDARFWFSYDRYHEDIDIYDDESENEARKLVGLLKDLTHVERLYLEIGDRFARRLSRDELPKSLPAQYWLLNLKLLSMDLSLLDANVVSLLSFLLRSCPNLRELFIEDVSYKMKGDEVEPAYWERQAPPECLMHHLATVQISKVHLTEQHVIKFATFLLKNACVLNRMTISHYASDDDDEGEEVRSVGKSNDVKSKIASLHWASPYVKLVFNNLQSCRTC